MASMLVTQCLIGLKCKDFCMIASDQTFMVNGFILNTEEDRIIPLKKNQLMGVVGDQGDMMQLISFIKANLNFYEIKNGYQLSNEAVVHFVRKTLSDYPTTGKLYLNLLMGGWDESEGGQLYLLDYLGTCAPVNFGTHGFAGMFCNSIIAHHYRPALTESEAYEVLHLCIKEVQQRQFINLPVFHIKVLNKKGVFTLPVIATASVVAVREFCIDASKTNQEEKSDHPDKNK